MTPLRDRLVEFAKAPWLQKVWLYRVLYAFAIQFDALVDWVVLGVKCRFPQYALPSALGTLGRERGIRRGLFESDAQYAARLINWVPDRKRKGSPYALMNQIAGYFTGYPVKIRIVNNRGTWYTREADGTETWHRELPSNWVWDTAGGTYDARYYVIVYVNTLPLLPTLWGIGLYLWGDGVLVWGGRILQGVGESIKAIIQDWNPPSAQCDWVVFAKDFASFDPTAPYPSAGFPDGTWDQWVNRLGTALYMRGH
jgi:hypothetical protein